MSTADEIRRFMQGHHALHDNMRHRKAAADRRHGPRMTRQQPALSSANLIARRTLPTLIGKLACDLPIRRLARADPHSVTCGMAAHPLPDHIDTDTRSDQDHARKRRTFDTKAHVICKAVGSPLELKDGKGDDVAAVW